MSILNRRAILKMTGALAGSSMISNSLAASYPTQPIIMFIPYGPGGTYDAYAREFSKLISNELGVNVAPVNMPGGGGAEAIFELAQYPPTGDHISIINVPGILLEKPRPGLDVEKLTWIANLGRDYAALAVGANASVHNIDDLKRLSAKRPIAFATAGRDSGYFASKVFCASLDIKSRFITGYQGSVSSAVAAARGDVDAVVYSYTTLQKLQSSGLVRIIFSFQHKAPVAGIEDAGTVNKPDLGKISEWRPIVGPPGLSDEMTSILSNSFMKAVKLPEAVAWAGKVGTTLYPLDGKQTRAMFEDQAALVKKWQDIL